LDDRKIRRVKRTAAAEIRESIQARRQPLDPVSVVLGRFAQSLSAAGEVDPELALSYAIWPSEAMLGAVAKADQRLTTSVL
jgi:hypothetical protein